MDIVTYQLMHTSLGHVRILSNYKKGCSAYYHGQVEGTF